MFGAGFVTLADLHDRIPGDLFEAWAAYVLEYDSPAQVTRRDAIAEEARREAEHDDLMQQAARAAR